MVDSKKLQAMDELMFDPTVGRFKGLIYGDPGSGKTALGASIGDKVLYVMADPGGYEALFNHPELGLGTRIETIKYAGVSQLETLADIFDEGGTKFDVFDTVLLDTASNIASLDRDLITKVKMKKKGDDFAWEDQQWPIYNETTLRITSAFLKLMLAPINVVMIAHAQEKEVNGRQVTRPKFSPEIFAAISGQCSMIAYMTANEAGVDSDGSVKYARKIQYHPTRSIVAKTRIGGLPTSEDLPYNKGNLLHGSRLRQLTEQWKQLGGNLIPQEEAENERPDSESVIPVAAVKNTNPLESFEL